MTKWIIYAQDYGQPAPGDWYDAVTDAGLDNTGSQSVTSGIVSAIEDYKALGKDGLYFPPGTYLLSTALTVPNDSVLLGTKNTGPDACTAHLAGQVVCGSRSSFTDLKIGPETAGLAGLRNVDGADDTVFTRCHFRGGGAAEFGGDLPIKGRRLHGALCSVVGQGRCALWTKLLKNCERPVYKHNMYCLYCQTVANSSG